MDLCMSHGMKITIFNNLSQLVLLSNFHFAFLKFSPQNILQNYFRRKMPFTEYVLIVLLNIKKRISFSLIPGKARYSVPRKSISIPPDLGSCHISWNELRCSLLICTWFVWSCYRMQVPRKPSCFLDTCISSRDEEIPLHAKYTLSSSWCQHFLGSGMKGYFWSLETVQWYTVASFCLYNPSALLLLTWLLIRPLKSPLVSNSVSQKYIVCNYCIDLLWYLFESTSADLDLNNRAQTMT